MLLGHVISIACPGGHRATGAAREAARRAGRAVTAEIRQGRALARHLADGLYELVDLGTRERYEGKRQETV